MLGEYEPASNGKCCSNEMCPDACRISFDLCFHPGENHGQSIPTAEEPSLSVSKVDSRYCMYKEKDAR